MNEDLLLFNWKHGYQALSGLYTIQGQRVEVIHPGELNNDSGPDFFNAIIKLDDTVWAGNIEIHVKSSDWARHGHSGNPQYKNTILHVVAANDIDVTKTLCNKIPTLIMPYPHAMEQTLLSLLGSRQWIPCADAIGSLEHAPLNMWLTSLCIERMEQKTNDVLQQVTRNGNSWEEAFYQSVTRSLGLKINAMPMELLAKSTPLKILSKCKTNPMQLEALLMGQAGFLNESSSSCCYYNSLRNEYDFQRKKYLLSPIPVHLWKFMRLRPLAFPTIRLSQLAQLIHKSSGLFSRSLEAGNAHELIELFSVPTAEYWETHYTFGNQSKPTAKTLGIETISVVIINSVVPFMFAYGRARKKEELSEKAMNFLEQLNAEKNSITRGFERLGIKSRSASDSQSLVQLKTNYCDHKECLRCHVGLNILLKKSPAV